MNLENVLKNINLKEFEAFLAVSETLSFSEAAKKLNMSQPSISVKIKSLENRFNKKLFSREGKRVAITADGQRLAAIAKEIFESLTKLTYDIAVPAENKLIRISVGEAIFLYAFPDMLESYGEIDPDIEFDTIIGDALINVESVVKEESDIAFVGWVGREQLQTGNLHVEKLGYDELVLIVPKGHQLSNKKKVSIKEISRYPYVARKPKSGVQRTVTEIMKVHGISLSEIDIKAVFDNASSVIMAVFRDLGVSIVSRLQAATAEKLGMIKIIPLEEKVSRRPIYAVLRKKSNPKILEFYHFSVDYLKNKMEDQLHSSRN